jgi:hypothetical protein
VEGAVVRLYPADPVECAVAEATEAVEDHLPLRDNTRRGT